MSLSLFTTKKEIFYTLLVAMALFCLSFSYEFYKYKQVTTYSLHAATVKVMNCYEKTKNDRTYRVLKLKNSDFSFYTTWKKSLHVKRGDELRVIIYTKTIDFYSYLKGFYASTKSLHVKSRSKKNSLIEFVENQHTNKITKELYNALFFAITVSNELREDITKWGIAHLVAISGFHIGILSGILFFLFKPLYTFFQDRYFPYRNRTSDLSFLVFLVLGGYVYFIDMTPSVLRAFVMSLIGFFFFSRNIKIISFGTLFFTICFVLILFPHLVFSIAFWFSVSGVFFIFLFLYHFLHLNNVAIFILLHFWVYILMIPIIHCFFDVFSLYQFFSPFISMVFILFYPLSLILHVADLGGVMDGFLIWFFSLHVDISSATTPIWFLLFYLVLALISIRFKFVALLLPLFASSLILGLV